MTAELVTITPAPTPGVVELSLNDPDRLNPIGMGMLTALRCAFAAVDADDEIRCVILAGRGRAFSAGGDMDGVSGDGATDWLSFYERFDEVLSAVRQSRKPTVAAVDGLCYGAGMMLAAHCDFVVGSSEATFGLIEGRMGAPCGGVFPYLIGAQWAKFLALTGEIISAERARQIGFLLEVIQRDVFAERVQALAARIAAMPPLGVRLNKQNIDGSVDMMGWDQNLLFTRAIKAVLQSAAGEARSADGVPLRDLLRREGLRAFIAARDAAFTTPWLDAEHDLVNRRRGQESP